jgi:hypothetical protein
MKFDFQSRVDECNQTLDRIHFMAFPEGTDIHEIFAFKFTFPVVNFEREHIENGWGIWDAEREFNLDQGINFDSPTCVIIINFY